MALTPGTRLGSYEVTARIGVGGMGEVYQANAFDVSRDGQRFLMIKSAGEEAEKTELVVVQNFLAELERLVPTN